jgi:glycosyltransferase involved in cell wall biosynthesis
VKILHVETGRHFLGGPQQVIYLINALRERGHDNILVCLPNSGIDRVARQAGIRVQNIFCAGDLDLLFVYRLSQFLKEQIPDVVHCHSRRGADLLGGLAASYAKISAVVSRRVDNTEMHLLAALRYKPFKKIIAISEAIASVLQENHVESERIAIIRSAVDEAVCESKLDYESFRNEFNIDEGMIAIAVAGQLIPRKGHRYLLQAVAAMKDRNPNFRVVIFGDGYLNNRLRAQAASLELGVAVRFAGYRDDLDDFIGCFDLFVHPALAEGLGVATLKASAAGVPVVGFDVGGTSEAVDNGKTGILVTPESVSELQAAIEALIDNEQLRREFSEAGKVRMKNKFSIAIMAEKYLELYKSL